MCLKYTNKRINPLLSKSTLKSPSLLWSILDRSMASKKPMRTFMGVRVTAFPITCHLKKNGKANITI